MNRILILIAACMAASPAIAAGIPMHEERNNPVQWQVIGSVHLSDLGRTPRIFNGFEGRKPEEIGLFAPKEDVFCDDILVIYPNSTLHIAGRTIQGGMVAYVKLPADAGAPSTLMLQCHAARVSDVHIVVRRDRSETQGWHRLSNDRSKGRGSVPVSMLQKVRSIGLMPIDSDASCKSAELVLQDGQTRMLEIPPLKANRITAVDLPSGGAKLRKIGFKCDSTDPTVHILHLDSFARFAAD
jgi:hypothetical protein